MVFAATDPPEMSQSRCVIGGDCLLNDQNHSSFQLSAFSFQFKEMIMIMRITAITRGIVSALLMPVSVSLLCSNAWAHGVWVAQRTGEWTLVVGDGPVDDEYKAGAVKRVQGHARDGAELDIKVRPQARNVVLEPTSEVAAIGVSLEDGYWSQTTEDKWVAGPKSKVPGAKLAGFYQMYTHTLLAPVTLPVKPFGMPLEIVPLSDPMTLKKGQSLKVRVLFEGKPLAAAVLVPDYVNNNTDRSVKTDAQGRAAVKLRSTGLNVIKVSHTRQRVDRSEADEDGFSATLAFTLPQPKD